MSAAARSQEGPPIIGDPRILESSNPRWSRRPGCRDSLHVKRWRICTSSEYRSVRPGTSIICRRLLNAGVRGAIRARSCLWVLIEAFDAILRRVLNSIYVEPFGIASQRAVQTQAHDPSTTLLSAATCRMLYVSAAVVAQHR